MKSKSTIETKIKEFKANLGNQIDEKELARQCAINGVSISLRDKLEDFVSKYWYDNEYQNIDKQDHAKATESRENFKKWFNDNIEAFLKQ